MKIALYFTLFSFVAFLWLANSPAHAKEESSGLLSSLIMKRECLKGVRTLWGILMKGLNTDNKAIKDSLLETAGEILEFLRSCSTSVNTVFEMVDEFKGLLELSKVIQYESWVSSAKAHVSSFGYEAKEVVKTFIKKASNGEFDFSGIKSFASSKASSAYNKLRQFWDGLFPANPVDYQKVHPEIKDPAARFLQGFVEGLGGHEEWKDILRCVDDLELIIIRIIKAVEMIMTLEINKVIEGIKALMETVKEFLKVISPCVEKMELFKKLLEALVNIDVFKMVWRIISNPLQIIEDIKKIIKGWEDEELYPVGFGLGDLLRILLLEKESRRK